MQLITVRNSATGQPVFVCVASFDERHIPAEHGFTWDKLHPRAWATDDVDIARQLVDCADRETLDVLRSADVISDETYMYRIHWLPSLTKRDTAERLAVMLTPERIEAAHAALRLLASACDGAHNLDDAGFNGTDVQFGHEMARLPRLTPKQAAWSILMLRKYHRQLPADLFAAVCPDVIEDQRLKAEAKEQKKQDQQAERDRKRTEKAAEKAARTPAKRTRKASGASTLTDAPQPTETPKIKVSGHVCGNPECTTVVFLPTGTPTHNGVVCTGCQSKTSEPMPNRNDDAHPNDFLKNAWNAIGGK